MRPNLVPLLLVALVWWRVRTRNPPNRAVAGGLDAGVARYLLALRVFFAAQNDFNLL